MRKSKVLVKAISALCLLSVFCLLMPSPVFAFSVTYATIKRSSDWSPIQDVNGEISIADSVDISSYGSNGTMGPDNSVDVACDGTYVYFRFLLNGNPLQWNQSLNSWQVNQNGCYEAFLYSGSEAALTSTSVQTFTADLSKTNAVELYSGTGSTPIDSIALGPITQTGLVYTDNNYLTVTDTGIPDLTDGKDDLFTLEFREPLSWLTAQGISLSTPIRAFYGTSAQDNTLNKDYMTGSALDFTQSALFTFGNTGVNGMLYDTRDTAPPSNAGTWHGGETLTVNGYGWPYGLSMAYYPPLTVQIYDPTGTTKLWSGTVTPDGSGNLTNAALLSIPLTWTPGVYRINVLYPTTGASVYYDSFTLSSPNVGITKTVSTAQALESTPVTYAITLTNPATAAGTLAGAMTTLTDTLPAGFTYKTGSTVSNLSPAPSDPAISGQTLTWTGSWTLAVGGTKTLSFQAITPNTRGTFTNQATASGTNFGPVSTGNTASLQIVSPVMSFSKTADKTDAAPGNTITYTLTYNNAGDAPAYTVIILDNVPVYTTYVTSSTVGTGTTIQWSHNGGTTWNSSDAAPVTGIKWTVSPLAPNAGGTLGFKVTVN